MKLFLRRTLILLIPLTISCTTFNQGVLNYQITVLDQNQKPKSACPITLIETNSFDRKVFKTDNRGVLSLHLSEGSEWTVNIGEMRNYLLLTVPPSGESRGNATATYDVDRWNQLNTPPPSRDQIDFEEITQRIRPNTRVDANHELIEVNILSEYGKPYRGVDVAFVCVNNKTKYTTKTDESGLARFNLPLNQEFQIDVDGEENFEFHKTTDQPLKRRINLTYSTIKFKETVNEGGYIEQTFLEPLKPISNRVLVGIQVMGGPKNGIQEEIYLEMTYSNKKYYGITNKQGKVYFLLPKQRKYRVNFNYQKGAGVIDLSRFYGIGHLNTGFLYVPEERLQYPERFLPTKDDVPSYEISNFSSPYPDTEDDHLINVHAKWGSNKINSGSKEAILELGFSVKEPQNKKAITKPLNIAFVLDKSGSMAGEKMDLLKSAMFDFVEKLRPQDHIALIFFDTEAVTAYESNKLDIAVMKDLIGAATASGGTSIYKGLRLGYKEVAKHATDKSVNRLVLLTDGYGSRPVDEVIELSKKQFEKGISVSTIGVGTGYNTALIKLLSQYSGGMEHHVIESKGIPEALDREFESLLYPLASNVIVKVKYNNKIIYKTLYGIPESNNTNKTVTFQLDKVYSSLNRMALIKFKLDEIDESIENEKISIHVSYFDETKGEQVDIVKEKSLEWTDETDIELLYDQDMRNAYSIAVINQSLKALADLCDAENYVAAKKQLHQTMKSLKEITKEKYSQEMIPILETIKEYMYAVDQAMKNQAGMK